MTVIRLKLVVRGAVQGVGFRPFVYRLASELALPGWVNNSAQGVFIEVEGPREKLEQFLLRLEREKPPRSFIQSLEPAWLDPLGFGAFEIRPSDSGGGKTALVLPDIATCPDCLREIFDPRNRRYRYPFTNCTHCGPRFSIIEGLPYDRGNTSMKAFTMCPQCQAEYEDPTDRRFHAQPNACPLCGPQLELWDAQGEWLSPPGSAALDAAAEALRAGRVLAVKGLGGFHLMVPAHDETALRLLRELKHREEKPFAVMFPSLESVKAACAVSPLEERLLLSPESPIVLLSRLRPPSSVFSPQPSALSPHPLSPLLAPGNPNLGALLPYTPLHHLLLAAVGFPVVATSGNLSDEPICIDEREALDRLGGIAEVFLVHDRPIVRHVDDSIVRVMAGREAILRRARGYAPLPVRSGPCGQPPRGARNLESRTDASDAGSIRQLDCGAGDVGQAGNAPNAPTPSRTAESSSLSPGERAGVRGSSPDTPSTNPQPTKTPPQREEPCVLAVGAHLKNTVALAIGDQVFLSQHIGDLETDQAFGAFQRVIVDFEKLYEIRPRIIASDLHPDYLSTQFARNLATTLIPLRGVQHHVAHVLSCMAENELAAPALGVAWDGTGYGPDGTVWGGEFFRVGEHECERVAHFRPFRLPGGDKAVKEPRRTALGLLFEHFGEPAFAMDHLAPVSAFSPADRASLKTMLVRGLNAPFTSSVGRLFDAVAALAGLRQQVRFEGQAAMELEFALENIKCSESYAFPLITIDAAGAPDSVLRPPSSVPSANRSNPDLSSLALRGTSGERAGERGRSPGANDSSNPAPAERLADPALRKVVVHEHHSALSLNWSPALDSLQGDLLAGVALPILSARFHNGLAESIVAVARYVGFERVVLSGGCFQNRYLLERAVERLRQEGFRPYWHQRVPPNDGGIALGQVVAARRYAG